MPQEWTWSGSFRIEYLQNSSWCRDGLNPHGLQPLDLSSSFAFFTKLRSKMSPTLMSRCTFVVRFMSSIIPFSTLSSLNLTRGARTGRRAWGLAVAGHLW